MADGRDPTPAYPADTRLRWTEIFRCFQIALDPRKLLVAAAGILVMSFLWWLLSVVFYNYAKVPERNAPEYGNEAVLKELGDKKKLGTDQNYTQDDAKKIADERFKNDFEQWRQFDALAGPGGRLRTLPWYEYRGPNPFLFVTQLLASPGATWWDQLSGYAKAVAPVLIEPLVKLLLPVAKLVSPGISPMTRVYLFLVLLANVVVWAFCAGVITRIAAVQIANKGPVSLGQAVRFVRKRYASYLGAPLVPLVIIGVCVLGLIAYGVLGLIPFVGDVLVLGLGLPVVIIGGAVMAVFLVGLVGYPLMYPTLSAEGDQSDTFDALSRSVNYVYQAPWQYIWCWLVAILYGAACTLFVVFFTCLTVYVGKWAVGLPASAVWSDRKPEFLFVHAPESFGWRELLTRGTPYAVRGQWVLMKDGKEFTNVADGVRQETVTRPGEKPGDPPRTQVAMFDANGREVLTQVTLDKAGKPTTTPADITRTVWWDRDNREPITEAEADRRVWVYRPVDPVAYQQARSDFYAYNTWGAWIVTFWLTLIFLMMLGFSYSFFWTAATMIYFLLRKKLDEAELDEVFVEDDEPEVPPAPPKLAEGTGVPPGPSTSLPVLNVPPAPPVPPVVMSPPPAEPPPPAVPPYSFLSPPAPSEPKKADDEPKKKPVDEDDAPLG